MDADTTERGLSLLREAYHAMGFGQAPPVRRLFEGDEPGRRRWRLVDVIDGGRGYPAREHVEHDLLCGSVPPQWEVAGVDVDRLQHRGERVVVTGAYRCRLRGGWDVVRVPFAHIWTLRDGEPQRVLSYLDGIELRRVG